MTPETEILHWAYLAAPHDYVAMQGRYFAYEAALADKYLHEDM